MIGNKPIVIIFLIVLPTLFNHTAFATTHHTEKKLTQIKRKVTAIKTALSHDKNNQRNYVEQLKAAETALGHALIALKKTTQQLNQEKKLLNELHLDEHYYQSKLTKQKQQLLNQIRAAYFLRNESQSLLFFIHQDSDQTNRLMIYYHYINQNRLFQIHALQQTLNTLRVNQKKIKKQTLILKKLHAQQNRAQHKFNKLKTDRQHVITAINAKIRTKYQRLKVLINNQRTLKQKIERIKAQERKKSHHQNHLFARLKGKLPRPTHGHILAYFGKSIDHSELTWNGILIKAPDNQPVYAIADGKVVFADWMPEYGLLLIISHGRDYMTLYGRNRNLYKKVHDVVKKGDLIASVGKSGGHDQSALYLEIRYNAKPLNPMLWFKRKQ